MKNRKCFCPCCGQEYEYPMTDAKVRDLLALADLTPGGRISIACDLCSPADGTFPGFNRFAKRKGVSVHGAIMYGWKL